LLDGIINGIYQTFKDKESYKTFEEKMANRKIIPNNRLTISPATIFLREFQNFT